MTDRIPVVRIALPIALLACACLQAAAFWPGIMIWDSIRQYGQALTGRYDDWHPPAMNWLWRQMLVFGPGPAAMLVLQLVLYWGGFALLCDWAARAGRPRTAITVGLCALLPVPFVLMGAVIKDSLMAAALLMATGLIAREPFGDRVSRGVAIALLIGAATLRFNAVPACLPLLLAALPVRWRDTRRRLVVAATGAIIVLALAMPAANRLLHAEKSGVEKSLIIYDLGGITRFSGENMFPAVGVSDPVAVNSDCYTPVAWDRYAWWGDAPCAIGFGNVGPALDRSGRSPWIYWSSAIARHPLAYAEHRLLHFNAEERFVVRDAALPGLPLATDPNPWGFAVATNRLLTSFGAVGTAMLNSPLGWPACWLALGIGLLALADWRTAPPPALPIALSAVLYDLSYLPLGVASEVRYHLWTVSALVIATILVVAGRAGRGTNLLFFAPPAAVAAVAIVARELILAG